MSEQQAQQLDPEEREAMDLAVLHAVDHPGEQPYGEWVWCAARDFYLAARVAGCPDEGQRTFTSSDVEAIIDAVHDHGRGAQQAVEHGEIEPEDQDALPPTIEAAIVAAEDLVGRPLGAVAASPDERQVDPVIPSSGAAESRGGWPTGPVCDARLQKGN